MYGLVCFFADTRSVLWRDRLVVWRLVPKMASRFLIATLVNAAISDVSICPAVGMDSVGIYVSVLLVYNSFSSS